MSTILPSLTTHLATETQADTGSSLVWGAGNSSLYLPLATKSEPASSPGSDPVVLAGGDTRSGCTAGALATAAILDRFPASVPILAVGDYVDSGTTTQFADCFSQSWGRHKAQLRPVPGNHEYLTSGATPYFEYFGSLAGPAGQGYYSFDVGEWHIVALNSEINIAAGSAQEVWLKGDLIAHASDLCTLAYWHEPRFSSGEHGNNTFLSAIWQDLYDAHVEIVLNGHDHDYERFAPQNPAGALDTARGIREFVIGNGGVAERPFGAVQPNSEVRDDDTWGVLRLALKATSYDWELLPVAGSTFADSGGGACH